MNWGRSFLFGSALAAVCTVAALALTQLRPDARSESREGAIPMVKAPPGPIKVKPQDPGGLKVPHQDKSIYERLEGHRKVVPAADAAKRKATPAKKHERKLAQAVGPYRVQLGSFETSETAEKQWKMLRSRHADLIGGLNMVVERVALKSKGTMYRLQAGPLKSPDQAQKLCAALAKRKVGCLLVKS